MYTNKEDEVFFPLKVLIFKWVIRKYYWEMLFIFFQIIKKIKYCYNSTRIKESLRHVVLIGNFDNYVGTPKKQSHFQIHATTRYSPYEHQDVYFNAGQLGTSA